MKIRIKKALLIDGVNQKKPKNRFNILFDYYKGVLASVSFPALFIIICLFVFLGAMITHPDFEDRVYLDNENLFTVLKVFEKENNAQTGLTIIIFAFCFWLNEVFNRQRVPQGSLLMKWRKG